MAAVPVIIKSNSDEFTIGIHFYTVVRRSEEGKGERMRAALAHELDLRNRHIESLKARIADQEAYIERLEAACVKLYVNEMVGCNMPREVAEKQACDALKRIKEGGKDEDIRHEIFSQRKVETPTECKHEWEKEDGGGILTQSDSSVCKKCGKRRVGKIRSGDFLW